MLAPVYRHADAKSSIAGVGIHEFLLLQGVAVGAIQFLSLWMAALALGAAYGTLRAASFGRPQFYWQHRLAWHLRLKRYGGRRSATTHARHPTFLLNAATRSQTVTR